IGQIDLDLLIKDICCIVAKAFGFDQDQYEGSEVFIPMIRPQYPNDQMAKLEFSKGVSKIISKYDFTPSFQAFIYQITNSRMVENNLDKIRLLKRWLSAANNINPDEKKHFKDLYLYDKLQRFNARDWIISLIQLIKLSGKKGLVVAIDDLDILTKRNSETRRFFYTKNAVADVYEILRQLIDDTEILEHFLLLVSGDRSLLEDLDRGFRSYDALWIRLQTGLAASEKFNSLADLLDIDKHFESQQSTNQFLNIVYEKLHSLLASIESLDTYHHPSIPNNYLEKYTSLQQRIIEATCLKGSHL
ncbi:MAG: BREX system ATP-binding domain-containing protein, partial [Prochlorotrichaceae cyanobacterium]